VKNIPKRKTAVKTAMKAVQMQAKMMRAPPVPLKPVGGRTIVRDWES
jgi:hypothetical protein